MLLTSVSEYATCSCVKMDIQEQISECVCHLVVPSLLCYCRLQYMFGAPIGFINKAEIWFDCQLFGVFLFKNLTKSILGEDLITEQKQCVQKP